MSEENPTDPEVPTPSKSRRLLRWLLATLAVFVVGTLLLFGYRYQQQMALIERIEAAGGEVDTRPWGPGWFREFVGKDRLRGVEQFLYVYLAPPGRETFLRELQGSQFETLHFLGGEVTPEQAQLFGDLQPIGGVSFEECSEIADEMYPALSDIPSPNGLFFWYSNVEVSDLARLKQMKRLRLLDLSESQIIADTTLPAGMFPSLRNLDFDNSDLTDDGLAAFKSLNHLDSRLDLSGTRITNAGLAHLSQFRELTELSLFETSITDNGVVQLQPLRNLMTLNLGWTAVQGSGLANLKCLPHLEDLLLHGSAIDDEGMKSLSAAVSLVSLELEGTEVSDKGLTHIKSLLNLKRLSLAGTNVSDASLKCLIGFTKLKTLTINGTNVSEAGIKRLRNALPNCAIYSDYLE